MISTNHQLFSADPPVSFLKNLGYRTIPWDLLQGFQLDCLRPDQRLRPPSHRLLPQARPSQKALVEDAQSQYPTHPHRDGPAPRLPQSPQLRYPRTRFALEQGPDSILGPVPEEELVLFGNLCSALNRWGVRPSQIRGGAQIARSWPSPCPRRLCGSFRTVRVSEGDQPQRHRERGDRRWEIGDGRSGIDCRS